MPTEPPWLLRPIRRADDEAIAAIIRSVMTEHGCAGPGFAIHDDEVAAMSQHYRRHEARYYVVEHQQQVLGGGGFAPLQGVDAASGLAELRKMYFLPAARGRGLGQALLRLLLAEMRAAGFRRCYLETTTWMQTAQHLYLAQGFVPLPAPLGATGHHGCDRYYSIDL